MRAHLIALERALFLVLVIGIWGGTTVIGARWTATAFTPASVAAVLADYVVADVGAGGGR